MDDIKNVSGEKEVMMRLAFFAAKAGFNSIVDLETSWTKIKNGSFKADNLGWKRISISCAETRRLAKRNFLISSGYSIFGNTTPS